MAEMRKEHQAFMDEVRGVETQSPVVPAAEIIAEDPGIMHHISVVVLRHKGRKKIISLVVKPRLVLRPRQRPKAE